MSEWFEKMRESLVFKIIRSVVLLGLSFAGVGVYVVQPSCTRQPPTPQKVSVERMHKNVSMLSDRFAPRSYEDHGNLSHCAAYIASQFRQAGAEVEMQEYEVPRQKRVFRNVIASFGPDSGPCIVVGAHYDSFQDSLGADDNASGIAGLIELAYLLKNASLDKQVRLVAFTLEEPPFFRTADMGSAHYAKELRSQNIDVEAMICLEMIGYFSDEKKSQEFPSAVLKLLYPNTGNYIALIGSLGDRKLIKKVKASMKGATDLPVYSLCAPKSFPGVDFSDHLNFWNEGYTAVMVTDTAFYRNPGYHTAGDTIYRIDFERMAKVVLGVYEAVVHLAE
jgi:hypothetical protein